MSRKKLAFKIAVALVLCFGFWSYFKMRLERISAVGETQRYQKIKNKASQQRQQAQEKMGYTKPSKRQPSQSQPKNL